MPTRLFDLIVSSVGEMSTTGFILRLLLAACSMAAMILLLSMWGTRYGDNNSMSKSFFASLLMHACFFMGWATVVESYPHRSLSLGPEIVEAPIPITFSDGEDSASEIGTNKLPVWHSGPASADSTLARDPNTLSRIDREGVTAELKSPQVDKAPEMAVVPDVPLFAAETEEQMPNLVPVPENTPKSVVSSPLAVDQPAAESRPDVSAKMTTARANITRPTVSVETAMRPEIARGGSSRTTPTMEDGAEMTFPSEMSIDALPRPQGAISNNMIRRPGSPSPAAVIDSTPGSGSEGNSNAVGTTNPRRADRIARPVGRPGDGRDELTSRPSSASNPAIIARSPDDRMFVGRGSVEPLDDSPQPNFVKPAVPSMSRAPARAPETYQARSSGQRMSSALKHGGSEDSERAVENSLRWMASVQEVNGSWSAARHGGGSVDKDPQGQPRLDGGKFADTGITGLVVLSFLGAGYTHERGPYTSEVRNALNWLIAQQLPNGYLGGNSTKYDQNYCHAIATFALAEAYAMQKDANEFPELRNSVKRGVKLIAALQNDDGGWRYSRGVASDMSMFGWQLMALKSAVNAGIPVPEDTRRGMVSFLDARGRGVHGGLAGYKKDDPPTPAMTAEALFCRQMFAVKTKDAASQEAVAYLRQHLPRLAVHDEYYWYYGTLAMHHVDDQAWQEWNNSLRDMLISLQRRDGPLAGSWDPKGKWAGIGGRLYSTTLSTMCLEVYYRYQSTAKPADGQ